MEAKNIEKDEKIIQQVIEDEMRVAYLRYSMSVIVSRALPDVKDGLKPVQRRILYAMNQLGLQRSKPFRKSAHVIGRTMAEFHPHGDQSIYDTMVRMAQEFSLRYPLVNGQGNFGSIDGDPAGAARYTEARMQKISEEMLQDINKDTVDFVPNYDEKSKEPVVLPAKVPSLLLNGSTGIAVGMATNIPPHNLKEVCNALIMLIDNPEAGILEIMEYVKGPDFPTGAIISGRNGILSAYKTGRGIIKVRARADIEEHKGKDRIIVTEIPYMVNKANMIISIAELVKNKRIEGITDIRDESNREGIRVVIDIRKGFNADVVLNQLYKHTSMQTTFGANMLALYENQPKVMNLKQIMHHYLDHRKDVIIRRTRFELRKAEDRLHILEGLRIALKNIDAIVKDIKASKSVQDAKERLMKKYELTEVQSQAILDMKLQKLTSLEQNKIEEEYKRLLELIKDLKDILASEKRVLDIIRNDLEELKEKYGDDRRTEILDIHESIESEDLIPEEDMVVTATYSGYIKRTPMDEYKQQKRGGTGKIAATMKEEDVIEHLFTTSTHSYILFFSNKGKVYWLKTYQMPTGGRYSKGKAIINLLRLKNDERITAMIPLRKFKDKHYLLFATKNGLVKKTDLSQYANPRKGGIIAIGLRDNDKLVQVKLTPGNLKFILATKKGQAVKFDENDVRPMGRAAAGVRGIRLGNKDEVVGLEVALDIEGGSLLTITRKGYGKRTSFNEYNLIRRGGKGVRNMKITPKNGDVIGIKTVMPQKGIVIRTLANDISQISRNTQGVRVIRLRKDDKVTSVARVIIS